MRVARENGKFLLYTKIDGSERLRARAIGGRYVKEKRRWEVRASVMAAMKILGYSKPGDDVKDAEEYLKPWREDPPLVVPATRKPLMPIQEKGASLILHRKRWNLWNDMGTGKTATVIGAAQELFERGEVQTVLVIAPISVFASWERQIVQFANVRVRIVTHTGSRQERIVRMEDVAYLRKALSGKYLVFALINYEALRLFEDEIISKVKPDMVVFDECNYVKNRRAKMSECAARISRTAKYAVSLTGTPIANNVGDLFSQLHVVSSEFVGDSYWDFVSEFASFGGFKGKEITGVRNQDALEALLKLVSTRVRKEDVLTLPERTYDTREVFLKGDQKKAYDKASSEFYFAVDAVKKHTGERSERRILIRNALSRLLRCQQIASGHCIDENGTLINWPENPKRDEMLRLVKESGDQKVVVFSRFVEDLVAGHEALKAEGIESAMFYGDTDQNRRAAIENEFLKKSSPLKVVLAQVRTGGFGVDFSSASIAIFWSNWFSWSVRDQAESRLHRLGQTRNVSIYDLTAVDTVDELVLGMVLEKKALSEVLFGKRDDAVESEAVGLRA